MTILSAFDGGLWIIPIGLALCTLYSFYRGYRQSKGGSLEQGKTSGSTVESDKNIPFLKCPATIYGIILAIATVIVYYVIKSEA